MLAGQRSPRAGARNPRRIPDVGRLSADRADERGEAPMEMFESSKESFDSLMPAGAPTFDDPYSRDRGDTVLAVSASVGAAMTDDPTSSPSDLLSRADGAMYLAKTNGRNQFRLGDG
jgi:GGDEF domain-containing protein